MTPEKTPLESWIGRKITGSSSGILASEGLKEYQLNKLGETLDYVREKSSFYQRHLGKTDYTLTHLEDMAKLPFTTADDLRRFGQEMICVKPSDIHRIVTLQTSGTTGQPKRVFFTEEDQELTLDFFHQGMLTMVKHGDRVLILLPGRVPGSVGELLQRSLARAGAEGLAHGPVCNPQAALEHMIQDGVNVLVGIPTQILTLARVQKKMQVPIPPLRSVLLTTDYVPHSIVRELVKVWGCQVFNHYGMTEMGLGGGVDCQGFNGYHLREADLYFEIIDPSTSRPVQEGQSGEVVFTTLTRTGMPLIRYRTGDYSRFILEACPCGTVLRNLERVRSRDRVDLGAGKILSMADLDEAIFALDGVLNFSAVIAGECGKKILAIEVLMDGAVSERAKKMMLQAIETYPIIQSVLSSGQTQLALTFNTNTAAYSSEKGTGKRMILDQRGWGA
ncbi:coenzyme F390 synthetase [Desulfitobacterium dehalogenans ATCC 51507]|uniref:Coenzyme F390 synthetase n=1 Tax=Desulfitobacterium dehalogenans (strain ATCC 51507 / DSM 9161 / JW/IU-DC1) TaxID=756499 RepID=I4AAE2_DESDJ|nr:AMP-binding protein [Desulfitobacterium dehalogenans]AFM00927.1 coenzyme F390 synthetase [Desulfitobacterium dehalogenans ATCC 51507]